MFDRLQRGKFCAVHQSESVANVLRPSRLSVAMYVIFRMLGHVVIDNLTHSGDVESARRDIRCDHHFVLAALETVEGFDALALGAVGMQDRDGVLRML